MGGSELKAPALLTFSFLFLIPCPGRMSRGKERKREAACLEPTKARQASNPLFPLDFSSSRQMRRAHTNRAATCNTCVITYRASCAPTHTHMYEISVADRKPAKTPFYSAAVHRFPPVLQPPLALARSRLTSPLPSLSDPVYSATFQVDDSSFQGATCASENGEELWKFPCC